MKPRKRPPSARILNQWVDSYAREHGQTPARVRNWVSHMVLGGALERAGFEGAGRKFTIKGGVALEMRLRHLARATKDLDLILLSDDGDPGEELEQALAKPYQGFTFRVRNSPEVMPNGAIRLEVALQYLGKAWGTVQIDASRYEGDGTEIEMVEAISLTPFGLHGPDALPCLSLPYHVAQKIHAMTLPPREGWVNQRCRDLIDLLLLREWITDFETVERACREVFEVRGTHRWPPLFTAPDHWEDQYARMAADLGLAAADVHQAAFELRAFVSRIDKSAEVVIPTVFSGSYTAVTWFFVVSADGSIIRVPAEIGEGLYTDELPSGTEIPPEWHREPGGVALIGVVLVLQNRQPVFVERVSARGIPLSDEITGQPVAFTPEIWMSLAAAVVRLANSPERALHALAIFLSNVHGPLPSLLARSIGTTTRVAHKYFVPHRLRGTAPLWDLWASAPVSRRPTDSSRAASAA
jgi:hypothetical protein